MFPTDYDSILNRMESISPEDYGNSRNYIDGAVTQLSPYISRGVISTKQVFLSLKERGCDPSRIQKYIQELAWRDYWQQIWIEKGELINDDLKHAQPDVENHEIPQAIVNEKTGIEAIDQSIESLYETGYLHNHLRMYLAAMACNIGKSHWKVPARWMYYHLLDADWASNALSWQWVAGANSNKKYFANQENINKYCHSNQLGTFLDVSYDDFESIKTPEELLQLISPDLKTSLPPKIGIKINDECPTLIYNFYNLDPKWRSHIKANRILLLEPSHFEKYPISSKTVDFILDLAKNIPGIQVFTGEFSELKSEYLFNEIYFKEHPTSRHYIGQEDQRDWMFSVKGYFPSFFTFWKKCKKEL